MGKLHVVTCNLSDLLACVQRSRGLKARASCFWRQPNFRTWRVRTLLGESPARSWVGLRKVRTATLGASSPSWRRTAGSAIYSRLASGSGLSCRLGLLIGLGWRISPPNRAVHNGGDVPPEFEGGCNLERDRRTPRRGDARIPRRIWSARSSCPFRAHTVSSALPRGRPSKDASWFSGKKKSFNFCMNPFRSF